MVSRRTGLALIALCCALLTAACAVASTAHAPTPGPGDVSATQTATAGPAPSPSPVPTGTLERLGLAALSPAAADAASALGGSIGIAVYVPSERRLYQYNAEPQFRVASVVKVPIMLTVLDKARGEGRALTERESYLLNVMIEESDNDATTALWNEAGGAPAVQGFLQAAGIDGVTIDSANWGDSTMSAEAAARLLGKLLDGTILDGPSRELAMSLMSAVDPAQSWGAVVAGSFEGPSGLKNGWYPEADGWVLGSIGYVMPEDGTPTYTIAVFTSGWASFDEGIHTIEAIAGLVNSRFE